MYLRNKTYLVAGISKSGFCAGKLILKNGGTCYIFEELSNENIEKSIKELIDDGGIRVDFDFIKKNIEIFDELVLSPGIPLNHKLPVFFKENNKKISGELEFGYNCLIPFIVAVTGTNGKTTTVNLLKSVLDNTDIKSDLVGNVGVPITSVIEEIGKNNVEVVEVSSFQLETVKNFKPNIACILNITPDHLKRHFTMENYIFLKKRILNNQSLDDIAILNYDDKIVRNFCDDVKGKLIYVSIFEKVNGAYVENETIYYKEEKIMNVSNLSLNGEHNLYNVLFCVSVLKEMKIDNEIIVKSIIEFKGVKHRIEYVDSIDGKDFYNDSKSTNTGSTIVALKAFDRPIILLLGGREKGEEYDELFSAIKESSVRHVILYGESRFNIFKSAIKNEYTNISIIPTFESAVKFSIQYSTKNDVVLLSPACASFDEFNGFEERGEKFIDLVLSCNEKNNK